MWLIRYGTSWSIYRTNCVRRGRGRQMLHTALYKLHATHYHYEIWIPITFQVRLYGSIFLRGVRFRRGKGHTYLSTKLGASEGMPRKKMQQNRFIPHRFTTRMLSWASACRRNRPPQTTHADTRLPTPFPAPWTLFVQHKMTEMHT